MAATHLILLALAAFSVALSAVAMARDTPLEWRFALTEPVSDATAATAPRFETVFDYRVATGQAHSPGIVLSDDGFALIWFQGSQEAQADVDIFAADFTRTGDLWQAGAPHRLITRAGLSDAFEPRQLVVTLGNTIQNEGAQQALYTTAVSIGGWAMASIADVRMADGAPVRARKLNLSPLLNRSFLVKSPMVQYADGSHALPAYFEMGRTYGSLVRLDAQGRVRDMRRMPGRARAIQPMIVPLDASRAVAFLRDFDTTGGRLLISRTEDGGQSWSRVRQGDIANPSSPVAALHLGEGRILMAVNDDVARPDLLRLTLSADGGQTWRALHEFSDGTGGALRYPMMRALPGDEILLSYSIGTKQGLRAHAFNRAWLAAQ